MTEDVLGQLRQAVLGYDCEAAELWANRAVEDGVDPIRAMEALTEAIRQVGDGFGAGELWLPDLVGAAAALTAAMPVVETEIRRRGQQRITLGTVVIGTVFGDIHSIGKTMVATLLTAEGFEVIDLGVNVSAQQFVQAIREHKPHILAMSALLTMTAQEQRKVIATLQQEGLRGQVKIMVGGGGITADFARGIGADGYDPTAPGAVAVARRMLGK